MKKLIVTADDVGLHPGMTEGAIRAHREGIVTACSIVANGRAFDDAVERLHELPSLEMGVHIALVEETALTRIRLPQSYVRFIPAYVARMFRKADLEREMRAQIEKVLATGLRVTHLNGHQHLHALPSIFGLVVRLAEEYRIGYVRVPADRRVSGGPMRVASVRALNAVARYSRRRAYGVAVAMNDATLGIAQAGHVTSRVLMDLLAAVPDGVTELVTHPGVNVDAYSHWRYQWDEETRALCDRDVRAMIQAQGIGLTTPSAL